MLRKKPFRFSVLAVVVSAVLLLLSVNAFADTNECLRVEASENNHITYIPEIGDSSLYEQTIYEYLFAELRSMKKQIDVSGYGLDASQLQTALKTTINMYPELFYVSNGFSYYSKSDGTVKTYLPNYTETDTDSIEKTVKRIQEVMKELSDGVDEPESDIDKLLLLHDRLAMYYQYDESLNNSGAAELFLEGTAVCNGYASAFYALASRAGIDGGFVASEEMNHIWNAFYLDGAWYHADVTWDDPTHDRYGNVKHTYFLKSNAAFTSLNHYGFTLLENDSDLYDEAYWNDADTQILLVGACRFFIRDRSLTKYNTQTEKETVLYTIAKKWSAGEGYVWQGAYTGLDMRNGRLYFNLPDSLYSCDLNGENVRCESMGLTAAEQTVYSIYGFYVKDGKVRLHYGTVENPNMLTQYATAYTMPTADGRLYLCDITRNADGSCTLIYINEAKASACFYSYGKTNRRISNLTSAMRRDKVCTFELSDGRNNLTILDEKLRPLSPSLST